MKKNKSVILSFVGIALVLIGTLVLILGIILLTGPEIIKRWGVVSIVFSGLGIVAGTYLLVKAGIQNIHQPDPTGEPLGTILEEYKTPVDARALPIPEGVHLKTGSDELELTWKRLLKSEKLSLWVGLGFLILSLVWFITGKDMVYAFIYLAGGILLLYFFLVIAVNKHILKVTRQQLSSKFGPLPFSRKRLLNCAEIIQLITIEESATTKYGVTITYALMAVTRSGKLVRLVSGKVYETIHYFELVIEDWLGIKDVRVAGEVRR